MCKITKVYNQADTTDKKARNWYTDACRFSLSLGVKYRLESYKAAGVIAALSPMCSWTKNKVDADHFLDSMKQIGDPSLYKYTSYNANVLKAVRILEARNEKEVFKILRGSYGFKTASFFWNIYKPESDLYVTIDRHAYRIATGEDVKSMTERKYNQVVRMYREAASKLGERPINLQAIVWTAHRRLEGIDKRHDVYDEVPF